MYASLYINLFFCDYYFMLSETLWLILFLFLSASYTKSSMSLCFRFILFISCLSDNKKFQDICWNSK